MDEIDAHLSGRLLTASEAVHRLLELPLHKEWPHVVRLDVHLPQQQRMVFDPTADEDDLLEQLTTTTSTLMAWFTLNADDAFARTLLYHQVPAHYVWSDRRWNHRVHVKARTVTVQRTHGCNLTFAADSTSGAPLQRFSSQPRVIRIAAIAECSAGTHVIR